MNVVVDCREKKLSSYLNDINVTHTTESLALGDIVIKNSKDETLVIFERKSLNDLLSSISDGRYEEQSYRLSQCGLEKRKIYYIIEGNIENYVGKGEGLYTKTTIHSCIYSITYVKGFSLICSNSLTHTGDIIANFFKKISGTPSENTHATYLDSIKLTKKSNLTDEMVAVMMLAQIPKVSKAAADTIMRQYKYSIPALVNAINEDTACLDGIVCVISNNKQRKLSKPCISNIKKYFIKV